MLVYHSSNVKLTVLTSGQYLTPDKDISKSFGLDKPGDTHYLHVFNAEPQYYPTNGRYLDPEPQGELALAKTPEGEYWLNYTNTKDLIPLEVTEY